MKSELKKLFNLIKRNIKVYFKDKMLFFISLITPLILIILFLTFLGNVYKDNLLAFCVDFTTGEAIEVDSKVVNGFSLGWLFSSIISVCAVTVAFCSNVMVNDKINKTINDFSICPVKRVTIEISYFIANFVTTFIVCFIAFLVSLIVLAIGGFFLSFSDILMLLLLMIINILFGSLLASLVEMFLSSQGALSGICTIVSSMYGFLSGAYMPISSFDKVIQNILGFLPSTYGTVLFRKYYLRGCVNELSTVLAKENIEGIKKGFDFTLFIFDKEVEEYIMFIILLSSILVLFIIYIVLSILRNRKYSLKIKKA